MNQATDSILLEAAAAPAVQPSRWIRARRFLPELGAVLATILVFWDVLFQGDLPGDLRDARWTIALHEHWYRVWTGAESVRDLHYYYPLPNTLGTSDAYLVQGQFYSLARLLGFDLVDSWVFAQVIFFLLGALGVAVLGRKLLDYPTVQTAFVVLCCASYAIYSGYVHVQLFGMLTVSWIFVGLHDLVSRSHVRRGIALLVLVPPLLGLSSWYPLALAVVVLGFLGLCLALVSSRAGVEQVLRQIANDIWRTLRSITGVLLIVAFAVLWAAVLWVYLPARALIPTTSWPEVASFSPRWSDIWNATAGGAGIWSALYARVPELSQVDWERQFGFTPVLFVAFVASGLGLLRAALLDRMRSSTAGPELKERSYSSVGRAGLLAVCLAVVAVISLFLVDDRGFGFFRLVWSYVPGMDAVRAPFRVMAIVYGMVFVVLLRSLELTWQQSDWLRRVHWIRCVFILATTALVTLIFAEMHRPTATGWTKADLLAPALLAQVEPARANCDAVIVLNERPEDPPWSNPIDAVIFSTISGLPTPQGYSRADPQNYPGAIGATDSTALVQWMRERGFGGRVCFVSGEGVVQLGG